MRQNEIENIVQSMVGKLYKYNNEEVRVLRYDLSESRLKVITDIRDIVVLDIDIPVVLKDFQPVADDYPATSIALIVKQTTIGSMAKELKTEVMDAIKKVKQDKNYIPQAVAINDGIKQILDIAKTEIEMFKAISSLNKN